MRKKTHVWEEACSRSWLLVGLVCEVVVLDDVLSRFLSPLFIRSEARRRQHVMPSHWTHPLSRRGFPAWTAKVSQDIVLPNEPAYVA
jgi:hypothetical protein